MKIVVGLFLAFAVSTALADTKIVVRGSGNLTSQLAAPLAEAFGKKHPDVSFDIASSDEDAIKALKHGEATVALTTDSVKEGESSTGGRVLHPTVVAFIGMMLVVNNGNRVDRITREQALKIFSGKLKNWSELGGAAAPIDLYAVPQSLSVFGGGVTQPVEAMSDDNQVVAAVTQDAHGLGIVSTLGLSGVKQLTLDDVKASIGSVRKHAYVFSWPVYLYTQGLPAGGAKDFLWFILSPQGQDLVEKAGFASLK